MTYQFSQICENLTIFILTYNRPEALRRQLEALQNFSGTVIVLDGGSSELKDLDNLNKPLRFNYIKKVSFYERFAAAGTLLKTDYALTFSDDDLLLPTGINELMKKMINGESDSIFGRMLYAYPLKVSWGFRVYNPPYSNLQNRNITESQPNERALTHFSNYSCVYFYSIMKAEVWLNTYTKLRLPDENLNTNPFALELAYEFMGAISGSSHIVPILCAVRVKDLVPTWPDQKNNFNGPLYMYEWLSNNQFTKNVENYKVAIIEAVKGSRSNEKIKELLDKALYQFSLVERLWVQNHSKTKSVSKKQNKFTISNLIIFIEVIFVKLRWIKFLCNIKSKKIVKELNSQSIKYNQIEIQQMIMLLLNRFKTKE